MPTSPSAGTPPVSAGARPGGAPADLADVWATLGSIYSAFTEGDRAHIDSCMDPEATMWDSASAPLIRGRTELDRVRDARPTAGEGPVPTRLTAYDEVIDIFDDLAVARYWLRIDFRDLSPELVRNTAVLKRSPDGGPWLIVHIHEDVQKAAGTEES